MGFRFRRSIRIAPGLRINVGKRGVSLSAGVRGASVTVGPRGTYSNVGIPGTGLSYRQKVGGGSEQRRNVRAQQRLEKEYQRLERERLQQEALSNIKLSLDKETGVLQIENAFGVPLSRQDIKLFWEQKRTTILEWLEQQAEEINGDVELLTSIHQDTPSPDSQPEYEMMPFDEQLPEQPKQPEAVPKPELKLIPPLGFFARLIKGKRIAHEKEQQQLQKEHEKALLTWEEMIQKEIANYQEELRRYEDLCRDWNSRKKDHEAKENDKKTIFPELLRTNEDVMNKTLEDALSSLTWPRETLVSYQIADQDQQVWLDVDLPEIEDLPHKLASVSSTGKKLNIKNKSAKQLQLEYAQHIHDIAFRGQSKSSGCHGRIRD